MDKKIIVKFNSGEKFEVDATFVSFFIARKLLPGADWSAHKKKADELLEDEFLIFSGIWDIPWSELKSHAVQIPKDNVEKSWGEGLATVSANW